MLQLRPATILRRRPLLCALLVALTVLGGCAREPLPDFEAARRAVRTATRLARPLAPHRAKYLDRLSADAELATAAAARDGNVERAQAAWLRATRAAAVVSRALRTEQERERRRYQSLFASTRDDLARARMEAREAGMGRREAAALARATTLFATAERLAAADAHGQAADKLVAVLELNRLVHAAWAAVHSRFSDPTLLKQWKGWVEETVHESREQGEPAIVVDKLRRRLILFNSGREILSVPAELGANGLQRKEFAGDRATPEGRYLITEVRGPRATKFYKALLINYPNDDDRRRFSQARRRGTISSRTGIGSLIEIHGEGGQGKDWTDGCVALTNEHMDKLFAHVRVGTPVTIVGTYGR